jgi:hypothetical protein
MSKDKQQTAVATTGGALAVPSYVQNQKRGLENVTTDDLIIPRLDLVQSLSKARSKGDSAYIEGAQEGDLFNSVTRELYGPTVTVVPLLYRREFAVWKSRKSSTGGGYRGSFKSMAEAQQRMAEQDEDDLEIVETPLMFVVIVRKDGTTEDAVVSMPRTKSKIARTWVTLATMLKADLWAKQYVISTTEEKNARGERYFNYSVKAADGWTPEALYVQCAQRHSDLFASGRKVEAHQDDAE